MNIGITGHQNLPNVSWWKWVRARLDGILSKQPAPIVGITSLARGADQLFAKAVLRVGGTLHAVVPFEGYERTFNDAAALHEYRQLVAMASKIETLPARQTDEESFHAAGVRVVNLSQLLIAVWDGAAAKGLGGTADIVEFARSKRLPVIRIDPAAKTIT